MLIIFGFKDFWRIVVLEILNKRQRGALRWSTAFSSDVALLLIERWRIYWWLQVAVPSCDYATRNQGYGFKHGKKGICCLVTLTSLQWVCFWIWVVWIRCSYTAASGRQSEQDSMFRVRLIRGLRLRVQWVLDVLRDSSQARYGICWSNYRIEPSSQCRSDQNRHCFCCYREFLPTMYDFRRRFRLRMHACAIHNTPTLSQPTLLSLTLSPCSHGQRICLRTCISYHWWNRAGAYAWGWGAGILSSLPLTGVLTTIHDFGLSCFYSLTLFILSRRLQAHN